MIFMFVQSCTFHFFLSFFVIKPDHCTSKSVPFNGSVRGS